MSIEKITLLPGKVLTCTATGSTADFLLYSPTADGDYTLVSALTAGQSATVGPFGSSKVYAANSDVPVSFVITDSNPASASVDGALADGVDLATGTSVGSKIGTAANQKLGKWGVTPVVQPASANQAAVTLVTVEDKFASVAVGTPPNHLVITAGTAGAAGNSLTVEAVLDLAPSQPLTAAIDGNDITITLGTDSEGEPDATANTATLAAAAVDALEGVTAEAQGDGSSVIPIFSAANLSGGKAALTVASENATAMNVLLTAIRSALVATGEIKGSA